MLGLSPGTSGRVVDLIWAAKQQVSIRLPLDTQTFWDLALRVCRIQGTDTQTSLLFSCFFFFNRQKYIEVILNNTEGKIIRKPINFQPIQTEVTQIPLRGAGPLLEQSQES